MRYELGSIRDILRTVAQSQQRTQQQLDHLREDVSFLNESVNTFKGDVDIAFQTIGLMNENADRERESFRSTILGIQEENRRIWQYLMRRDSGNGDGPQS